MIARPVAPSSAAVGSSARTADGPATMARAVGAGLRFLDRPGSQQTRLAALPRNYPQGLMGSQAAAVLWAAALFQGEMIIID